jgi:hypothetical protein
MAADFKIKYPATSSVAITIGLGALASDANLLAGREGTAVDNTTNLDQDHVLGGFVTTGTSPTVNTTIEVWAFCSYKTATGTPTYPDVLDGTDSNETITNAGVKGFLRLVDSMTVTATSDKAYPIKPCSILQLFGFMPKFWGIFVVHNTGVNLHATAGNHVFEYERIQAQSV